MTREKRDKHITEIMNDPERVCKILQSAIMKALLEHKKSGNPVCGMKDRKIFWVQPENIIINEIKSE